MIYLEQQKEQTDVEECPVWCAILQSTSDFVCCSERCLVLFATHLPPLAMVFLAAALCAASHWLDSWLRDLSLELACNLPRSSLPLSENKAFSNKKTKLKYSARSNI